MSCTYITKSGKMYRIEDPRWPHYNYVLRLNGATLGRHLSIGNAARAAALHALESRELVPHSILEWIGPRR